MRERKKLRSIIATFLTLAMLLTMLPTAAFAAEGETDTVDLAVFKNMQLYSAVNHRPISTYFNADKENYYQTPTTLGSGENQPLEWMLLSYAIQLTQPVSLALYKLSDDYADLDDNPIIFEPDEDPDAQEEFLGGERIGYLAGIRMTDNVEPDPDKGDGYYKYVEIDNDVFCEMLVDHINSATELTVMKDVVVYGFDGEPLIVQRPVEESLDSADADAITEEEAAAPSVDESANVDAPETESDGADAAANPDAAPDSEPEPDSATSNDSPAVASDDAQGTEVSSLDHLDEGISAAEDGATTDAAPIIEDEPTGAEPVSEDMDTAEDAPNIEGGTSSEEDTTVDAEPVLEEEPVDAVAENSELPVTEGKIQNYLIWNGMLASEDGTPISYNYTDGKYIIVLEPTTQETKRHNSFLAFSVSTTARPDQLLAEEYPGLYYEFPGDPVNLLTGSFSWSYTDMMMYGKYNLPFARYYESTDADRNHGLGYGWSSDYSIELELDTLYAKVTLPGGKDIYFDYYYDGSYRAQAGSAFTFNQVGGGYQLVNDDGTVYLFDSNKNIRSVSTLDGDVVTYTYNGGQLASVSNSSGTLSFAYNGDGNIKSVTDSVGRTVNLSYNGDYLISAENADSDDLIYAYDASSYLTQITNFNGDVYLTNSYDGAGRVVSQYVQDEGNFQFTYDDRARQNTCTGENGYYLSIVYDELGRIIQSTNSEGTKYISYNSLNQRTSETDREGNTTEYAYDANGNVILVTYADGLSESYTYNAANQITSFTDRGGNRVSYVYDGDANLVSMTDGRSNTVGYTYDDNHNATSYTDALGSVTRYTYDAAGNRTSETDPAGNVTTFAYDSQGRCVSATDAAGSITRYEYTQAGKLVKTTDANGSEMVYTVDGNGFNLTQSDWMGNITAFTYNAQNSVTSVTDPLGNVTRYDYDTSGNMSVSTDANSHATSYTYDAEGRMISMTNASGKTWSYTYDRNGNLLTITDPLGGKVSSAYNSM